MVVGNHLAQHRELSLTAIGLATHILSVPEGTPVDIRSLAERFPEGRERIASALRELEAHGYLERVREHTESGRLVTRTYAHHTPAAARSAAVSPAPVRVAGRARTRAPHAVSGPRVVPESPQGDEQEDQDDQDGGCRAVPAPLPPPPSPPAPEAAATPPPTPTPRPAPTPAPPEQHGPRDPQYGRAVALLAGLRRGDDRLVLSLRDVNVLAPGVVEWLRRGVSAVVVRHMLVTGLPTDMRHPAGVIAYRLRTLMPPPLPEIPEPPPAAAVDPAGPGRRDPLQNCDGCDRAFRAPRPGRCRDCRAACPEGADGADGADRGVCAA
ncbi:helix-turn-helix domain-containing protein [Streptomyces sp. NPDC003374]